MTATFFNASSGAGGMLGAWSGGNSYNFNKDYARISASANPPIALPNATFTAQAALEVDPSAQTASFPTVFGADGDFGGYTTASAKTTMNFKADTYDGNTNNGRPAFGGWTGKYLNLMFTVVDGVGKKCAFQTIEPANFVNRASPSSVIGTRAWGFGASAYVPGTHYMTGRFHGVRFYNRALTNAELAQNREADEARYRGNYAVTNVVVAVSPFGCTGTQKPGVYTVRGTGIFTAAPCVKDGRTFTPTGYTLRKWNATENKWSEAEEFSGASYTYTVGDSQPTVKLAWKWEITEGMLKLDAKSYVADGLRHQFDGIENAGFGAHDAGAETWKDLAGGVDAQFHVYDDAPGFWTRNGYWFDGHDYAQLAQNVDLGQRVTVQLALDVLTAQNPTKSGKDCWAHYFGTTSDGYNIYVKNRETTLTCKMNDGNHSYVYNWKGRSVTAVYDYNRRSMTQTDSYGAWSAIAAFNLGARPLFIGTGGASDADHQLRLMRGLMHAVRIYNRALTEEELAWNYAVDAARFRGGVAGNVVVASNFAGAEGAQGCGQYLFAGTREFSAPAETNAGSRTYALVGWRIENWDAAGNIWRVSEERETDAGAGATVSLTAGAAAQRLTWRWRVTRGVRSGYTIDDYVQDGLTAQFDGIDNRGRGLPQSEELATWCDASGNGLMMDFANQVAENQGVWSANAYSFKGGDCWQLAEDSAMALGNNFTIEQAVTFDATAQTDGTPNFLAFAADGIYSSAPNHSTITWKTDSWTGATSGNGQRPAQTSWNFRYITAAMSPATAWLFDGTAFANARTRADGLPGIGSYRWTIGSAFGGYGPSRRVVGDIHSTRVYSRVLTEEELVRNRRVDEYRFRDAGIGVTNVVVAPYRYEVSGTEPSGVYEVEGSWTFTTQEQTRDVRGKEVVFTPYGYTVEVPDGDGWRVIGHGQGDSYTYTVGVSPDKVRLSWLYQRSDGGTVIIVR